MTKIYLVNDTSTSPNWGCRGTTAALRTMIESVEGCEISESFYLSEMYRMAPGKSDKITLSDQKVLDSPVPQVVEDFDTYARYLVAGEILPQVRTALENCDVVLINGEGSIYDFQIKGIIQLFVAYCAKQYFAKSCLLVNFTADVHDPRLAAMAAKVFPLLDDIVFREPLSQQHCLETLPAFQSVLGADVAFTHEPATGKDWLNIAGRKGYFSVWPDMATPLDLTRPYICIGGSSIYYRPDRPACDPVPAYEDMCRRFLQRGYQVALFNACRIDEKISSPIAKALGLPVFALTTPTQQAIDILGNASLLISGRWHPSIFAATGGTPIVTFTANTHKTMAILTQLGLTAPTFDALNLPDYLDDILTLSESYIQQGDTLRNKILQNARELCKDSRKNIRFLTEQPSSTPVSTLHPATTPTPAPVVHRNSGTTEGAIEHSLLERLQQQVIRLQADLAAQEQEIRTLKSRLQNKKSSSWCFWKKFHRQAPKKV